MEDVLNAIVVVFPTYQIGIIERVGENIIPIMLESQMHF